MQAAIEGKSSGGDAGTNARGTFLVPTNTLLFRKEGPRIAIAENDRADLRPVTIGHDYERTVEVVSGLKTTGALILNPTDSIEQDETVAIVAPVLASAPTTSAPRAS